MKMAPILLSYLTLMCFGLIDNGRGPAYPSLLETFHINTAMGSLIFTLSSIAAVSTNFFSKKWLPLMGAKMSLQASLFLQFLGAFLYALSAQLNLPFFCILIASVIFGVGAGSSNVCISIVIVRSTDMHIRRRVFSGLHSIYAISSLLSPLIFSLNLKLTNHWPTFFFTLSLIPLAVILASFFLKVDLNQAEEIKHMGQVRVPLKERLHIGTMLALNVTAEVLISSRLVFYLQEHKIFTPHLSSLYLSLFFLFLLIGRFIPAIKPLPYRSVNILLFSSALSALLVCLGLFLHPIFLSIVGASMAVYFPTTMDWISKTYPKKSDYMIASALNYVGMILIFMHLSFGHIVNWLDIQKAMFISVVALATSIMLIIPKLKAA